MGVGDTENLTSLENLNEETLLAELEARYKRDVIYTYVGEILVAVNPYKRIDGLYNASMTAKYTDLSDKTSAPPHIFAVADAAFTSMVQNPPGKAANQVCVISGESGAGKTESAKLFTKQIISLSERKATGVSTKEGLEDKIVQLNPLLEAFGNAQTLMNDNSSRFGKFVELRFNKDLQLQGALMNEYLLEKSRVVEQSDGERNFHVFYLFFAGLTPEKSEQYMLNDASFYRYINGNPDALEEIQGTRYKQMYDELISCMDIVGFTEQEISDLFAILAGILHTGDVQFSGEDAVEITSEQEVIQKMTSQLGVNATVMTDALTKSINVTRGEAIERPYKLHEAEDSRDAMAKALYGKSFSWIVARVNKLLGPPSTKPSATDKSIGILDIFGFEHFDYNSFEQLLINLANEQLQFFFNDHIFKMELDEYAREGIDGSKISYEDNQPLLDMLLSKPLGLLSICDEEALFPKGTDTTMLEKLHTNLASKFKAYEKPRGLDLIFTIHHYAGRVTYQAEGFLEKNRDTLALDVVAAMRLSTNKLVRTLFGGDEEDAKAAKDPSAAGEKKANKLKARGKGGGRSLRNANARRTMRKTMKKANKQMAKAKKTTVGGEFKKSLASLMTEMSSAAPHFIRCLKPNLAKSPGQFDGELVTKQLRYTGMLETTRIRKEGYSHRPTFADFIARYKPLGYYFTDNVSPTFASCDKILTKANLSGWQVGKTKVFLRFYHQDKLSELMAPFSPAAITLQKIARGFIARRRYIKLQQQAAHQKQEFGAFALKAERFGNDIHTVLLALNDEDEMRPDRFWEKKEEPVVAAKGKDVKVLKKLEAERKKGGKFSRAASVRWFKEVEMKKGAALKEGAKAGSFGCFEDWFHGCITRKQSETLLNGTEPGTFLVRVSESRFGYSLSHCVQKGGRIRHLMIDQTKDGKYQLVGDPKTFASLNDLVAHFATATVLNSVGLLYPCGQGDTENDTVEFLDKKAQKELAKAKKR
eukprot:m.51369 g.51369  ORF g.51369 m.51369 type:complete len:987 (+) comp18146_c0_seq1:26-2986(+)